MADTTGKDTPSTDPKPAGKSGPVKPPVLEGTARSSNAGKPGDSVSAGKAAPGTGDKPGAPPSTPRPREGNAETGGSGSAWLAGLVGGALGLAAAYGLAWFGLWPQPPQVVPPADPRLAQFAAAIPELETVTNTVQDELSTLTSRVGTLEQDRAEAPAVPTADPALAEEVQSLSARLDELAATPAGASDAEALAGFKAELERLGAEIAGANAQLAQTQEQLAALSRDADDNAGTEAATVRLPLIFSSLESAFAAGRPFETELAALRQALPETIVPEAIAGRAAGGLPRPDTVERQLVAALPDMLAGRPASADANWQDATADWFRGLIAMRPAGAVEGDGPDATIARLEAAVARRDFTAAQTELHALPETMRNAAGSVAADIESLAVAETFLAQLRTQLLAGENGA